MDHPKNHSLFGLGLPDFFGWVASPLDFRLFDAENVKVPSTYSPENMVV